MKPKLWRVIPSTFTIALPSPLFAAPALQVANASFNSGAILQQPINGVDFDSKSVGATTTDNGWNLWSNCDMQENTAFTATTQLQRIGRSLPSDLV